MDADVISHELTYINEAGFHLRNREGEAEISLAINITLCAAITQNAILLHHANMGPLQNPSHFDISGSIKQHHHSEPNVSFQCAAQIHNWFQQHP